MARWFTPSRVAAHGQSAGAVAFQSFQRSEGAVIGTLGIRPEAQVSPEAGFLLLDLRFGHSPRAAAVVAADVGPEFAIDAPRGFQVPAGVDELLHEDALMRVARLVGFHELLVEALVLGLEGQFGVHHLLPFPRISRPPGRPAPRV